MKFLHLSDLHLGKRVNEYPMLEDQRYILGRILEIVDAEQPDGVLIAGDVYDKSVPAAEAVTLLDDFLTSLSKRELEVFVISGNHDSPERMTFGARLIEGSGVHIAGAYTGSVTPREMTDEYGVLRVYLLPFIKPAQVRGLFEEEIVTYTDAVRAAIRRMEPESGVRNVLVTHQFVTGGDRTESEEISVGGTDQVDASVFDGFDYLALGHLHRPQNCGGERIRYCGTPLKYSFSEARDVKSVTVAELGAKGTLTVRTLPLTPLREMTELKGRYQELSNRSFYENTAYRDAYLHITLTDEEDIPDAVGKLRPIYRNLMKLDYDNRRTGSMAEPTGAENTERRSPVSLFSELYELQNNHPMTEEQIAFLSGLIEEVWEDEE